ncbi:hypothetical protein V6N11_011259 [Hibiscus sabdariffa]|uniref:C2H2-type domain-containing protein n=1 Tax=Hibiscus sabdariffa TaxID=183260 RepID=A0ABR2S8E6_9ROSI
MSTKDSPTAGPPLAHANFQSFAVESASPRHTHRAMDWGCLPHNCPFLVPAIDKQHVASRHSLPNQKQDQSFLTGSSRFIAMSSDVTGR